MIRALAVLALLAGCGGDDRFMIVTVDVRPAVHLATKLEVTLTSGGSTSIDTRALGDNQFPVTFAVATTDHTGDLDIHVRALDASDNVVGAGDTSTPIDAATASVTLDGADFVVNSDVTGDQFLTDDFEAAGLQLAASSDGTWMVTFRDGCNNTSSCDIFGRRFDETGLPLTSAVASNALAFPVTTTETMPGSQPTIATAGGKTLVFWDYADTVGTATGVACRAFDSSGNAIPGQLSLIAEAADVVAATPLSSGNFALSWNLSTSPYVIHTMIAKPDCTTTAASPAVVSTDTGSSSGAHRAHLAANGSTILYAWTVDVTGFFGGDVHIRAAGLTGQFAIPDTVLAMHATDSEIDYVRVAPLGSGFAVLLRWGTPSGSGTGKIELYRVATDGTISASPTLISNQTGADIFSDESFGVATRSDGALMVVWQQCPSGSGSCDVYGRVVRPSGVPVGDPFQIPTTTMNDQTRPSVAPLPDAFVVAWNDASGTGADPAGFAVRARVIYPRYDDASSVLGALCGGTLPACEKDLVCASGSDSMQRCYAACMSGGCPEGGTCDQATQACTF